MARKHRTARKRTRKDPAARERALEVPNLMRNGLSFKRACRIARTTPRTVFKYVPRALVQAPNRRWAATRSDRYTRRLWVPTKDGKEEASVRGSRQAELVAAYWAAADWFLRTGDASRLAEFRGKRIRSGNRFFPFLTNTKVLERLAQAGEMSFERLYTRRA